MLAESGVQGEGRAKNRKLDVFVFGHLYSAPVAGLSFERRYSNVAYQGVRECAVCAWREGCRLKYRNEPNGAIFCPEFSPDLRIQQTESQGLPPSPEGLERGANDNET